MPRVPGSAIPDPISMDISAPGIDSPTGSPTANALANVGGRLADQGVDAFIEISDSNALAEADKAHLQDTIAIEEYRLDLDKKYPDGVIRADGQPVLNDKGEVKTITDEYKEWAANRFRETQERLGGRRARELYRQKSTQTYYAALSGVKTQELKAKIGFFDRTQEQALDAISNLLISSPNPDLAKRVRDNLIVQQTEQGRTLGISAEGYDKRVQTIRNTLSNNLFRGILDQAMQDPKNGDGSSARGKNIQLGLDLLYGKIPGYDFHTTMDPEKRSQFIREFLSAAPGVKKQDTSDWRRKMRLLTEQASSQDLSHPTMQKAFRGNMTAILNETMGLLKAGAIDTSEAMDTTANLIAQAEANPVINSKAFRLASPEQRQQMLDEVENRSFNGMLSLVPPEMRESATIYGVGAREQIRERSRAAGERLDRLYEKDPVLYFETDDKVKASSAYINPVAPHSLSNPKSAAALRERSDRIDTLSYASGRGKANKYLKEEDTRKIVAIIDNITATDDGVFRTLKGLYDADPARYGKNIQQIIEDGKLNPRWNMALLLTEPKLTPIAKEIISAMRLRRLNEGAEDDETILKKANTTKEAVMAKIYGIGEGYFSNMIGRPGAPLNEVERGAMRDGLYRMVVNRIQGGASADDAFESIKQAFDSIGKKEKVGSFFGTRTEVDYIPTHVGGRELSEAESDTMKEKLLAAYQHIPNMIVDPPAGIEPEIWKRYQQNRESFKFVYSRAAEAYTIVWVNPMTGRPHTLGRWIGMGSRGGAYTIRVESMIKKNPTKYSVPHVRLPEKRPGMGDLRTQESKDSRGSR